MRQPVGTMIVLVLAFTCFGGTCRKTVPPAPAAPAEERATPPAAEVRESFPPVVDRSAAAEPSAVDSTLDGALATVRFAYDRHDIDETNRQILRANADRLKKNQNLRIVVEGHCDERGTLKYNLALGERRAHAVRQYLADLGVDPSRVRIISYGEDRPAVSGQNEEAWAKNRRAEFKAEP